MFAMFPTDCIYLKVKGYEKTYIKEKKTRWVGEGEDRRSEEYYIYHNDENQFYSHKFTLHTWGNAIPIGQFSIPF